MPFSKIKRKNKTHCLILVVYLICSNQVHGYADVSKVYEPKGLVEAEPCEEISWCIVSKCCITQAATQHIEQGCSQDANQTCSFHDLVFWRARFQGILQLCGPHFGGGGSKMSSRVLNDNNYFPMNRTSNPQTDA